ncbi:long-chain acyl-CoA synthetase [Mycobacterium sp. MAA66]|uniref:AMP-binding protein n=1 Tax=Mycobacterium sp. MAA66 TaxID=3156297 RepID=UPI003513E49A
MSGVRCGRVFRDYDDVRARASAVAGGLAALGVEAGDRVAICLHNDIAFIEASVGVGMLGAIPVPVNWHWKGAELAYLLDDSDSKVIFANTSLVPTAEAVAGGRPLIEVIEGSDVPSGRHSCYEDWIAGHSGWSEPPRQAPMAMVYTSGTTGRPKGIVRAPSAPAQSQAMAGLLLEAFGLAPGMRTLVAAPMYHSAPNAHALVSAAAGVDLTIMGKFDAEDLLRQIAEHQIDHFQAVPTMFVRLLNLPDEVQAKYDVSSLKSVVHAAAPCPIEVKRRIIDWFGPIVREYYGGTETGPCVACDSADWLTHPGTVGRPIGDADVRIYSENGDLLPEGESGRIHLRPPSVLPNFTYHGNPDKRTAMEHDGYLDIGDVGYLDHDGFLYLNDRSTDMIISGGVNIYPAEIEACLIVLDGVRDVAVFGIPDDEFGESIAAHVEATGLTEDDVREHVRSNLAGYKVPKVVVFDDNLPREDTGKLMKRKIRAGYWPVH